MKIGPIDFTQPSTWRGLLVLLGLIGWNFSPELREQVATALATGFAAIEMFRDEYRTQNTTLDSVRAPAAADPVDPAKRLRQSVPSVPDPERDRADASGGFNDR